MSATTRSTVKTSLDQRRVIIEFEDTARAWNDFKHGYLKEKSSVRDTYSISFAECTKMYISHHGVNFDPVRVSPDTIDIPSLVRTAPTIEQSCSICRKYHGHIYPCRICSKVYHQQCVKDLGHWKSSHFIKNATNLIGWSCPFCEDLRGLLTSDDLQETMTWIKSLQNQSMWNIENYINTRLASISPMYFSSDDFNERMKLILQTYLSSIVDISANRLNPQDLITLDVSMKLLRTSPKRLLHFLTPMELYRLSQMFLFVSSPDDALITSDRFQQVFRHYLSNTMSKLKLDNNSPHLDLNALSHALIGDLSKSPRTWSQFLLDSTVQTLLARSNHRSLTDFVSRAVSIKHSDTPSTAHILEEIDDHAVTVLIANVLEKLRRTLPERKKKGH